MQQKLVMQRVSEKNFQISCPMMPPIEMVHSEFSKQRHGSNSETALHPHSIVTLKRTLRYKNIPLILRIRDFAASKVRISSIFCNGENTIVQVI